ncbi:uncharacterized protein LOC144629975 [Oculina patagonica]
MWQRSTIRIREVLLGVLIGLGIAGLLVVWRTKGVRDYMKQTPMMKYNAGADFREHTTLLNRPVLGSHKNEVQDEPYIEENEQSALDDKTVSNGDASSSNEPPSQSDLYEAYSHVKTILFFIGYSRSRHSLLGSLLDAHPHMVISDETMAFGRWKSNPEKWISSSIYAYYDTMFKASERAVDHGRRSKRYEGSVANATSGFKYYVPNQWQGNYDQYIQVIGDKAGAYTAWAMKKDGAVNAVRLLEKTAGAKVKFIHVVRNPFDNIATMVLQHRNVKERYGEHKVKVNAPKELEVKIKSYFSMAAGSNQAREALPGSVIDIPSMEIVKNPAGTLRKICKFLEITCTEQYLQDCAATVDPVPSITRDFIVWTDEQKNTVYEEMKKYSFFEGYSFDK